MAQATLRPSFLRRLVESRAERGQGNVCRCEARWLGERARVSRCSTLSRSMCHSPCGSHSWRVVARRRQVARGRGNQSSLRFSAWLAGWQRGHRQAASVCICSKAAAILRRADRRSPPSILLRSIPPVRQPSLRRARTFASVHQTRRGLAQRAGGRCRASLLPLALLLTTARSPLDASVRPAASCCGEPALSEVDDVIDEDLRSRAALELLLLAPPPSLACDVVLALRRKFPPSCHSRTRPHRLRQHRARRRRRTETSLSSSRLASELLPSFRFPRPACKQCRNVAAARPTAH